MKNLKKYFMICLLIFVLFCNYSCNKKPNKNLKETLVAILEIKEVVHNNKKFFCTEKKQYVFLKDFNSGNYLFNNDNGNNEYTVGNENTDYIFNEFCIIDIDGDGNEELLLMAKNGNILLFRYDEDVVYGFVFPFRGMKNIKTDTSFECSGGASIICIQKINFVKDQIIMNELCLLDGIANKYRLNGNVADIKDIEKYLIEQNEKKSVKWETYEKLK